MRMAVSTPKIRLDQRVLKLLERISVELPLGEDAGDVLGQVARALAQAGLKTLEPAVSSVATSAVGAAEIGGWAGVGRRSLGGAGPASSAQRAWPAPRRGGRGQTNLGFWGRVAHGAYVCARASPCNRLPSDAVTRALQQRRRLARRLRACSCGETRRAPQPRHARSRCSHSRPTCRARWSASASSPLCPQSGGAFLDHCAGRPAACARPACQAAGRTGKTCR